MSQNASAWFKEVIKDKVTLSLQAHGGLLDSTMMGGDTQAGTVKFPVMTGRAEVYKLTGAIQPVRVSSPALSTIPMALDDFEASAYWLTQDAWKSGPSEQESLKRLLAAAVRRKRDTLKLDALVAFQAANASVTTIGTNVTVPDILHFEQARAEIGSFGLDAEDDIFCMIPEMWMTQLKFYDEFGKATWSGPADAPFSQAQRTKMRVVQGVTYIVGPDEYFTDDGAGGLYAWMWAKHAIGAETPVNMENATLDRVPTMEGTPYLAKVAVSGAAIGIEPKLVKRFLLKKITAPVRPA